jgi:hypothetical protein
MTFTASEQIAITGLTPKKSSTSLVDNVGGARATAALICAKTNPVDYTYVDGASPSANTSIRNAVGVPLLIYGYNNIQNATYFNTDGSSATLYVQYAYD